LASSFANRSSWPRIARRAAAASSWRPAAFHRDEGALRRNNLVGLQDGVVRVPAVEPEGCLQSLLPLKAQGRGPFCHGFKRRGR